MEILVQIMNEVSHFVNLIINYKHQGNDVTKNIQQMINDIKLLQEIIIKIITKTIKIHF